MVNVDYLNWPDFHKNLEAAAKDAFDTITVELADQEASNSDCLMIFGEELKIKRSKWFDFGTENFHYANQTVNQKEAFQLDIFESFESKDTDQKSLGDPTVCCQRS